MRLFSSIRTTFKVDVSARFMTFRGSFEERIPMPVVGGCPRVNWVACPLSPIGGEPFQHWFLSCSEPQCCLDPKGLWLQQRAI